MADSDLPNNVGGQWSDVFYWPLIGLQTTLMPDGKILTFGTDQFGKQGAALIYDVWDPATNIHYTLPNKTPTDLFCCAAIVVPSTGEVLISGGDARPSGHVNGGVNDVNVFDYRDMSLSVAPEGPMAYERWYPTVVELANGKILILGGCNMNRKGVGMPELYTPGEGWKTLPGAYSEAIAKDWNYPRAWLAPNGNVILMDSSSSTKDRADVMVMDPSGNGTLKKVAELPFTTKAPLPAIKFAADKVLMLDDKGGAWVMDMSGDKPMFEKTGSLGNVRYWSNLVVLADGSIMVSGGSTEKNKLVGVHNEVQIWNPQTGEWTTGDEAAVARLYHSTTILLPDATVLSLGGGAPGPLINTNGEIYKPSYLFNADGSLATRPVIAEAPQSIELRQQSFVISVDDAANITRLTFIKTGSVTHSLDMSNGMLELNFTHGAGNALTVTVPDNSNVLAPGNWMLFAFNDHGTPSIAATISIGLGGEIFSPGINGYVTESGAATYDATSDVFTLTPNAKSKVGAVMSNDPIDLTQDFAIKFSAYLGSKDSGGSGIAFVLHNDPSGGDAFGGGAKAQGANGIANGLAISLDTFKDSGDPAADHTNFFDTDGAAGTSLTTPTPLSQLEDARWHDVMVFWDADAHTLTYSIDGIEAGNNSGDLAGQYFSGSDYVYFGFTGATGSKKISNLQQIKVTSVEATYAPTDAHPSAGADDHVDALSPIDGITITGSPDNDNVVGTPGADTLIGGLGADSLTGAAGGDLFTYRLAVEGGDNIKDFAVLDDGLSFSASGFGGGLIAGQQLVAGQSFIADANPAATSDAGTFLFNTDTNDLAWDLDGLGGSEAVQIAHFDSPVSLTINHFEITA
jgi:hypothetical protein